MSTITVQDDTQMYKGAQMDEGSFVGVGGLKIFTRSWHPAEGLPRAVVVIVHGFNSHSGHYLWVGEQFAKNGLAAHALDLRGRGQSDGERYYVDNAEDYIKDVATFVRLVKSYHPGLPVFLLGHSAGGVISCVYTLDHQAEINGLICESFAHELPAPDFALAVLKGLSHIAPHAHVLKLENAGFSRDPKVVEALNNDPLIANEVQPTQTIATMVRADERLKQEFSKITLPVFILHGTLDRVTKPSGSQHFYEMAGSTDKTLKLYEGHFHDLLNDIDKEVVMADIQKWIDKRIPAA
jgi:acylglycerol lipase